MASFLSSRNVLIFGVLLLASSPQITHLFVRIRTLVNESNLNVPKQKDGVYIVPGEAQIHKGSKGGKIHLSVCATNQFRVLAEETKKILQQNFPETPISVSPYKAPEGRLAAVQLLSAVQGLTLITTIFGASGLQSFGVQRIPPLIAMMNKNRLFTIFLAWMSVSYIKSVLLNTGAFEIYCDGHLIFSRLAEGELPALKNIVKGIQTILERGVVSQS